MNILEVRNLSKHFYLRQGLFNKDKIIHKAVDNVSLNIEKNETFALVGESGCGKTTLARCILRLIEVDEGKIILDNVDITNMKGRKLFPLRKKMQIIFQDPNTSLNPRKTIYDILAEGILLHQIVGKKEVKDYIINILRKVGISENSLHKFPHEFSGGQRQRIAIARAISLKPELIICDEAVSSLDVSIQAQIISLLMELKEQFKLSYLFIAHDLALVKNISDRIAIMFSGKIVETGKTKEVFSNPSHKYTQLLISSVPEPDPTLRKNFEKISNILN
ncbi:MAG: ABC transporter ATP-binding protein [Brevinematia bacterium]